MLHPKKLEVGEESVASGVRVYRLSGDLDGSHEAYAFQDLVHEAMHAGQRKVVVDLAAIRRIDSSGIGVLVSTINSASETGAALVFAACPPATAGVLRLTKVLDRVASAATVPEALERVESLASPPPTS